MKRFAPILLVVFYTLVISFAIALVLYNPGTLPSPVKEEEATEEGMCPAGDVECWDACDPGVAKCPVDARRARKEILAHNLPCHGVSEITTATPDSPVDTVNVVWCDGKKHVYGLDSLLEMSSDDRTPDQFRAAIAKHEKGIREKKEATGRWHEEFERRRKARIEYAPWPEKGQGTVAEQPVRCVGITGDCDTVAREMRSLINANGWACVTVDSVMKSVFSISWTVKCNRLTASFTVDKHGGRWRVQATD